MEMAYRERWAAEVAEMRRVLAGSVMKEERKWGKPTYTLDGKNVVIMQKRSGRSTSMCAVLPWRRSCAIIGRRPGSADRR